MNTFAHRILPARIRSIPPVQFAICLALASALACLGIAEFAPEPDTRSNLQGIAFLTAGTGTVAAAALLLRTAIQRNSPLHAGILFIIGLTAAACSYEIWPGQAATGTFACTGEAIEWTTDGTTRFIQRNSISEAAYDRDTLVIRITHADRRADTRFRVENHATLKLIANCLHRNRRP